MENQNIQPETEAAPPVKTHTLTLRIVNGFLLAAIAVSAFVVLVTIGGELWSPLKNLLAEQHHHHWIGKGIWSTGLFIVVGLGYALVVKKTNVKVTGRFIQALAWMAILTLITLFVFYIYEFFNHL